MTDAEWTDTADPEGGEHYLALPRGWALDPDRSRDDKARRPGAFGTSPRTSGALYAGTPASGQPIYSAPPPPAGTPHAATPVPGDTEPVSVVPTAPSASSGTPPPASPAAAETTSPPPAPDPLTGGGTGDLGMGDLSLPDFAAGEPSPVPVMNFPPAPPIPSGPPPSAASPFVPLAVMLALLAGAVFLSTQSGA